VLFVRFVAEKCSPTPATKGYSMIATAASLGFSHGDN